MVDGRGEEDGRHRPHGHRSEHALDRVVPRRHADAHDAKNRKERKPHNVRPSREALVVPRAPEQGRAPAVLRPAWAAGGAAEHAPRELQQPAACTRAAAPARPERRHAVLVDLVALQRRRARRRLGRDGGPKGPRQCTCAAVLASDDGALANRPPSCSRNGCCGDSRSRSLGAGAKRMLSRHAVGSGQRALAAAAAAARSARPSRAAACRAARGERSPLSRPSPGAARPPPRSRPADGR